MRARGPRGRDHCSLNFDRAGKGPPTYRNQPLSNRARAGREGEGPCPAARPTPCGDHGSSRPDGWQRARGSNGSHAIATFESSTFTTTTDDRFGWAGGPAGRGRWPGARSRRDIVGGVGVVAINGSVKRLRTRGSGQKGLGLARGRPIDIGDFLDQEVYPALFDRLDAAFPEFGWRRNGSRWIATNAAHTWGLQGRPRPDRVNAYENTPFGFVVHGSAFTSWLRPRSDARRLHRASRFPRVRSARSMCRLRSGNAVRSSTTCGRGEASKRQISCSGSSTTERTTSRKAKTRDLAGREEPGLFEILTLKNRYGDLGLASLILDGRTGTIRDPKLGEEV